MRTTISETIIKELKTAKKGKFYLTNKAITEAVNKALEEYFKTPDALPTTV